MRTIIIALVAMTVALGVSPAPAEAAEADFLKKLVRAVEKPMKKSMKIMRERMREQSLRHIAFVETPDGRRVLVWGIQGICGCVIGIEEIERCKKLLAQPHLRVVTKKEVAAERVRVFARRLAAERAAP